MLLSALAFSFPLSCNFSKGNTFLYLAVKITGLNVGRLQVLILQGTPKRPLSLHSVPPE